MGSSTFCTTLSLGQQVEELEDEADLAVADVGELAGGGLLDFDPVELDGPQAG